MSVRTSRVRGRRSSALMQGLMMNLPIELDANGNPKVIDWSSMVSALGERVDRRDLQQMFDHLMPYGMPNWDAIAELLARGADYIEVRQFAALAMVFVELETLDDVAQFLNTLRQPWILLGENIQFTHSGEIFPLPFNPHIICPRLVDGIAEHVGNGISSLYDVLKESTSLTSVQRDNINDIRRLMMGRLVLLSEVAELTPPASGIPPVQRTLTGPISLTEGSPDGVVVLNVPTARFVDSSLPTDAPLRHIQMETSGFRTIDISAGLATGAASRRIPTEARNHYLQIHQFNPISFIGQSVMNLGLGAALASGKGIPAAAITTGADIGTSFLSELSGAARVQRDIISISDSAFLALYVNELALEAVVVTDGSGVRVTTFPSSYTESRLELLESVTGQTIPREVFLQNSKIAFDTYYNMSDEQAVEFTATIKAGGGQ